MIQEVLEQPQLDDGFHGQKDRTFDEQVSSFNFLVLQGQRVGV